MDIYSCGVISIDTAVFIIWSCYEFSEIGRWTMEDWRNLSVDIKLLWNQPNRIGRCATLIGYPSMFFVNMLYVGHLIVEFCICILKAMTNYQPKNYSIVCCHWLCYMAKIRPLVTEYAFMIKLVDGTCSAHSFNPYAYFGHSWSYFDIQNLRLVILFLFYWLSQIFWGKELIFSSENCFPKVAGLVQNRS
jgi:hypothetical protein